ncbi:MAG: N-acetyltransferase [Calditrichaeota bacterium]|nr:MAG: N-acetyltransferase [Calditrichota bacterium]
MVVELHPFQQEDIPRLVSWIDNEPLLVQWSGNTFQFPFTIEQYSEYFERVIKTPLPNYIWKGIERNSGEPVGHIELCEVNLERKTGKLARVLVPPQFQGKGVATQMITQVLNIAFMKFGLDTITLNVVIFNLPAIACYKKVGFQIVKTENDRIKIGGKSWSSYRMELKRSTWEYTKKG